MHAHSPLALSFLGTPHIVLPDGSLTVIENHGLLQLLALLVMNPKKTYLKSELCEWFYPEHAKKQAEQNLRQMVHRLRIAFHDQDDVNSILIRGPFTLCWNTAQPCWVDVNEFDAIIHDVQKHNHRRLTACQHCIKKLEIAASLYQSEFMSGVRFRGPLEEWATVQRSTISRKMIFVMHSLVMHYLQSRQWLKAQHYLDRWLMIDALDEDAVVLQMHLLAQQGKRIPALQAYRTFKTLLASLLETKPMPETDALALSIQNGKWLADGKGGCANIKQGSSTLLTAGITPDEICNISIPFVGYKTAINSIVEYLTDNSTQLITITGAGGVGKTRLAVQVAGLDSANWLDGAWFVHLGSTQDLHTGLIDALGISLSKSASLTSQLYDYLRDKELLLVLDQLDYLPDPKHAIKMLLFHAPKLKIILTSRQRFGIAGEIIIELNGLAYPTEALICMSHAAPLQAYESVQLFYAVSRCLHPIVSFAEADVPIIAEICRVLCGYPFAIVLAVTWVHVLPCDQILYRMQHDLDFLKDIHKNLNERQASIRAVFDYSWQLLSQNEQECLKCLTQIEDEFSVQDVQSVYDLALEYIVMLFDKSFLEMPNLKHFRIQPLLKSFVLEKCRPS